MLTIFIEWEALHLEKDDVDLLAPFSLVNFTFTLAGVGAHPNSFSYNEQSE
jgi:hypothetical protein